jgi:hypothetical protein
MWTGLGVFRTARISELTHGKDNSLPVPLVVKPGQDNPTGYLGRDRRPDVGSERSGGAEPA